MSYSRDDEENKKSSNTNKKKTNEENNNNIDNNNNINRKNSKESHLFSELKVKIKMNQKIKIIKKMIKIALKKIQIKNLIY